jgi:hypothetical protein
MTFGSDPFGNNEDNELRPKKGLSPLGLFILFLILWYMFSRLAF